MSYYSSNPEMNSEGNGDLFNSNEFGDAYQEMLRTVTRDALERLQAYMRDDFSRFTDDGAIENHDDCVELLDNSTLNDQYLNTKKVIFTATFAPIHPEMVSAPTMPDYLRDIIARQVEALVEAQEATNGNDESITQLLPDMNALRTYTDGLWSKYSGNRLDGTPFKIYNGRLGQERVSVVLRQDDEGTWKIGYECSVHRTILHVGKYAYDIAADGTIDADPINE